MDGLKSSTALQKAILSVRAFAKYSRYIHWSGYQLTGREVSLVAKRTPEDEEVRGRVGVTAVFPRLNVIKKLETAFVKEPRVPTDVQVCVCVCVLYRCVYMYSVYIIMKCPHLEEGRWACVCLGYTYLHVISHGNFL